MDLLLHLYCVMYANVVLKTCLFQVAVVFQVVVNDCIWHFPVTAQHWAETVSGCPIKAHNKTGSIQHWTWDWDVL